MHISTVLYENKTITSKKKKKNKIPNELGLKYLNIFDIKKEVHPIIWISFLII